MTAAQLLVKTLEAFGVELVFGYPGAHNCAIYDALYDSPIRHVLVRHEQAAGFMADGYARATGNVGVCLTTAGPGATNAATAIATAHADSIPVLHLSAQIETKHLGRDCGAYHELDLVSVFRPMTKWAAEARSPDDVPALVAEAFRQLTSGRLRPVFLSLPHDVLRGETALGVPERPAARRVEPDPQAIDQAHKAIERCERPMVLAGGGAITSAATPELLELAEALGAPVATTTMGRGAFPDDHALALGWVRGGPARTALAEADLLVGAGCRFGEIATAGWTVAFPPVVHINVDPREIGKNVEPIVGVVADAKLALAALGARRRGRPGAPWFSMPAADPQTRDSLDGLVVPIMRKLMRRDAIVTTDVGASVWRLFGQFPVYEPRTFLHPATYIAMGHGLPAALGAKAALPGRQVVCMMGDGAFMMVCAELATAAQEKLAVPVIVVNDGQLRAIKGIQERQYDGRTIAVDIVNPDFGQFADSLGIGHARIETVDAFEPAFVDALAADGPTLIDVVKTEGG